MLNELTLNEKRTVLRILKYLDEETDIDWDDLVEICDTLEEAQEILDLMHNLGLIQIDYNNNIIIKLTKEQ